MIAHTTCLFLIDRMGVKPLKAQEAGLTVFHHQQLHHGDVCLALIFGNQFKGKEVAVKGGGEAVKVAVEDKLFHGVVVLNAGSNFSNLLGGHLAHIQLIAGGTQMGNIGTGLVGDGAPCLVVGAYRYVAGHRGQGIAQRGTILDSCPHPSIGII